MLPACNRACALHLAERMRQAVSTQPIDTSAGPVRTTASFGIATMDKARPMHVDEIIRTADEALYRAKRAGRNQAGGA